MPSDETEELVGSGALDGILRNRVIRRTVLCVKVMALLGIPSPIASEGAQLVMALDCSEEHEAVPILTDGASGDVEDGVPIGFLSHVIYSISTGRLSSRLWKIA